MSQASGRSALQLPVTLPLRYVQVNPENYIDRTASRLVLVLFQSRKRCTGGCMENRPDAPVSGWY
jgi:hypothetical protein